MWMHGWQPKHDKTALTRVTSLDIHPHSALNVETEPPG
jgi:hypothetical protein